MFTGETISGGDGDSCHVARIWQRPSRTILRRFLGRGDRPSGDLKEETSTIRGSRWNRRERTCSLSLTTFPFSLSFSPSPLPKR